MKKILLLLWLISLKSFAQKSAILEQYIHDGLASNLSLKNQNFELQKAIENIAIAKAMFSPKIAFAPTYSLAGGGRSLDFPVGDLLNPVYSTLNKLTQSSSFPQITNVHQLLAPNNFQDTKVSFSYPIFNTDIHYNYLINKQLLTIEEAKKRVLENELRYNITTTYLQYLQTLEANKVFENSRKILLDFVRFNQKLVNNNLATKDVIYSAEYEVSKLDQQAAMNEKNTKSAKAYFNFLLNKSLDSDILVDSILVKTATISAENKRDFLTNSLTNRQEINQLSNSILVAENAIKLQKNNSKYPQIFIGGNAGFQGTGYKFSNQAYYVAQAGLSWDIFHGYEKKHKIQFAKIQKNQLENKLEELKQQIQLQVSQAYFEVEAAKKSLETSKDGVIKTEKYFKVVESKYKNNQAILVEYLKAQNDLVTAQLQESLAKYDILVKQAMLDKVAAFD